jgi:hypothetical protein
MLPKFRLFVCPIIRSFVRSFIVPIHRSFIVTIHRSSFVHTNYSPSLFTITIHRYHSSLLFIVTCRRFDPGGSLDRRVKLSLLAQPRWVGARWNPRGKTAARVILRQSGCTCSRGYKRSRWRERECVSRFVSASSRATTLSYEGPGPSFYRCKERVQVYNGGVAIC